jgi:uncharacterized membrane protein YkvA (DUF1232 family)
MTDQPMFHRPPGTWRRLRRLIRHVPLIDRTLAAYYCARDPQTPLYARGAVFFALAYFIMPFDLIPDFIPFVAHIDDAAVMLVALRMVSHRVTPVHQEYARRRLEAWTG